MSRSYNYVDHTADIAVQLKGTSIEELFSAGSDAWLHLVVGEVNLETDDSTEIELTASSKEELLVTFLNELNYILNKNKWLCLSVQSIKVFNDEFGSELSAELSGIKLTNEIKLKQEIKSVTYQQIEIVQLEGDYSTLVVFDI